MEALTSYSWPGNVRELKNIIERMVIMTPEHVIAEKNLPAAIFSRRTALRSPTFAGLEAGTTFREAREEFEKEFLIQKLEENDWNISRTAEAIEIERSNLHRKIKTFGIELIKK
jgi:two-component system nitrogen regulation response regulator NtrX